MSNCLLAYPDRALTGTISGGSWTGLDRLQDDARGSLAQSADLSLASTQFTINLSAATDLKILAILDHNASMTAQIRVRIGNDNTFAENLFDSNWQPFWLAHYPQGGLPWGHPALWAGGPMPAEDYDAFPKCRYFVISDGYSISAQYVLVEINDAANPAGYFSLSRCILAPAWSPPINMEYGAQGGWDASLTNVTKSKGGVKFFEVNPKFRICNFTLDTTEAVGTAWLMEIQRKIGLDQELFFIFNPDDATMLEQSRSFLATMKALSAIEFPFFDRNTHAFQLEEKL